jgi:hypothetical protein
VAAKFARDFLRMEGLVRSDEVEAVWQEHRKPGMPENFEAACGRVREAIRNRPELLVVPTYSTKVDEFCQRCKAVSQFPLADAGQILSILGYC